MKYVIVGGDAAGMSAAMEIVRHDEKAEIITLEKGFIYSYGQCGLPYVIDGRIESTDRVIARSVEAFREKYGVDARVGHLVTGIDSESKTVHGTVLPESTSFQLSYDKLLIATGAAPVQPNWPGVHLEGIQHFKTIPDTNQLVERLPGVKKVCVIGGGYIGLEVAEALVCAGKQVRLIHRGERVAKVFDEEIAAAIQEKAAEKGIALHLNEKVTGFLGEKRVEQVQTDKGEYQVDLVVIAIGIKPATQFLDHTDIHRLNNGAILTNRQMETSIKDIYAAGDCAAHFHRLKGRYDYIPLGTTANKQGRIAGLSMCGMQAQFQGVVGTSILKFFDLAAARTGLHANELELLDYSYEQYTFEGYHIAGYYPGKEKIKLTLYYDPRNRRLLGAQAIGGEGVDKRIDVAVTALYAEMTIDELLDLDLAYAPPFNGVWDPLQQAARRLQP
ncbi:FAD-dependent oxidoreductase [Pseudobacillus badius]|uniref:FAD-dependent oxidoreductase n=1 Tax=Bacillus badius TaxID=1455 RepID=UPI003CFAC138